MTAPNRAERRERARMLARENDRWPVALAEWPRVDWPAASFVPPGIRRVFRSRDFLVQEFDDAPAPVIARLSVNRARLSGDRWRDGISWDDLQRIKNECGYVAHDAVEVYPAARDIVNVANMRHLWVLAEPLAFAWRK